VRVHVLTNERPELHLSVDEASWVIKRTFLAGMIPMTKNLLLEALPERWHCGQIKGECSDPRLRIHKHNTLLSAGIDLSRQYPVPAWRVTHRCATWSYVVRTGTAQCLGPSHERPKRPSIRPASLFGGGAAFTRVAPE
jgi:hypothetical protein